MTRASSAGCFLKIRLQQLPPVGFNLRQSESQVRARSSRNAVLIQVLLQNIAMHFATGLTPMAQAIGAEVDAHTHHVKSIHHDVEAVQTAVGRQAKPEILPHLSSKLWPL